MEVFRFLLSLALLGILVKIIECQENAATWGEWIKCSNSDDCSWFRLHSCSSLPNPYLKCNGPWEEKLICDRYDQLVWENPLWANDDESSGCLSTEISMVKASNEPSCIKFLKKYTDPSQTCNGNWGSWEPDEECSKSCGRGIQVAQRYCLKRGRVSGTCEFGSHDGVFSQSAEVECNVHLCPSDMPVWSAWGECQCSNGIRIMQRTCIDKCYTQNLLTETKSCEPKLCTTTTTTATSTTTTTTPQSSTTMTTTVNLLSSTAEEIVPRMISPGRNVTNNNNNNSSTDSDNDSSSNKSFIQQGCIQPMVLTSLATVVISVLSAMLIVWVLKTRQKHKKKQHHSQDFVLGSHVS